MAKNFLQIFNKYIPEDSHAEILLKATNIKVHADKENRIIHAAFDMMDIVPKDTLYAIENAIAKAYELNWVKLLPHYPTHLFDSDYVPSF